MRCALSRSWPDAGAKGVHLVNPLADNEGMLRSSVMEMLARRVEHNFSHMERNIRLFEVGVAFTQSETELSDRTYHGGRRSDRRSIPGAFYGCETAAGRPLGRQSGSPR